MKIANVSIVIGVIVVGSIATRAPAHAQPADAQPADAPNIAGSDDMPWNKGVAVATRQAAREVFLEGNRLFKIPLFSQAVEKYSEALEKWKHPAFYFNLAIAEINLGRYLEARENLERALSHGAEPLRADRYAEAKKQLVEIQRHLGRIRVRCATPGAEVTLDGATLFTGPNEREIWVTARAHEVTAKKPEHATQARRVTVAPGTQEVVNLSLHRLVEERPWATWKPWVVVGAGIGIAAAGGVLHGLSARDFSAYDQDFVKLPCSMMGCTQSEIDAGDPGLGPRLNRARLEQRIAVGGYIAGGAVIAAGVVLLYMNRPHVLEREEGNPKAARVVVVPAVSADAFGVLVTVSH